MYDHVIKVHQIDAFKVKCWTPPLDGPRATHHSLAKSPISWYIFSSSPNLDPRPWGECPRWKRGDGFPWGKFQPRLWQQFYSFDLVFMLPCWARRLRLQVCYRGVRLWSRTHTHTHIWNQSDRPPTVCGKCAMLISSHCTSTTHPHTHTFVITHLWRPSLSGRP